MKASAIFPVLVLLAPLALAEPKQGVTGGEGTVSASKGGFSRRSDVQLPIDQKTIDRLEKEAEEAADALLKDPAKEIGPVLDKLDAIAQRELMYQLVAAMTRSERFDSEKMKKPMANLEASARYNLARLVKAYRDPKAPRRGFNPTDLIGVVLEQRAENEKLPNESLLQTNYLAQELKIADVENQTEKKIFERKDPALAIKHFESYRWYDPTKEADKVKKYGAAITEYLEKVFAVAATKPSEVPSALPALLSPPATRKCGAGCLTPGRRRRRRNGEARCPAISPSNRPTGTSRTLWKAYSKWSARKVSPELGTQPLLNVPSRSRWENRSRIISSSA